MRRVSSDVLRLAALLAPTAMIFAVPNARPQQPAANETRLITAVCPIVYQLESSPSLRGYKYSFFGNGFFINEQGYLLTVAHVLENFRNGGQPYVLVSRVNGPPALLAATIVAEDPEHDVAILRVTNNPFAVHYRVSALALSAEPATIGQEVLALSLHPPKQQNAHTFEIPREDVSPGEVLSFETTQLERNAPAAEVFLLSHPVNLGQSGSPVFSQSAKAVVGLVEGRWLRTSAASMAKASAVSNDVPGAAVPVRYALALLEKQGVAWRTATVAPAKVTTPSQQ